MALEISAARWDALGENHCLLPCARPGKHLWVGAIGSSVTKEQLEEEFSKFGKIEELKFLRDRNSALVGYYKLEDAVAAMKNMNGKRLGGEQMRVDFLRSQPSKRDNWSDQQEPRDGHFSRRDRGHTESFWSPPDGTRNLSESSHFGPRRHLVAVNILTSSQPPGGQRGEGHPSNTLWIGYPPSVQIDEQMLHNAMILFGEIERIKCFPSRHYAFVEFRSIDEARRAKEGLQGRLFNDPRIHIMFSSSDLAPGKDSPGFHPPIRGPRSDMFFNEPPYGSGASDFFGHPRPMAPNSFLGPPPPNGVPRPNLLGRTFGPQGFDPQLGGTEFSGSAGPHHNFPDANQVGSNWRRHSPPAPGMLASPSEGMRPLRPMPGMWDGHEPNPYHRDTKRSRIDGPPLDDDTALSARRIDHLGVGEPFGASGPLGTVQGFRSPVVIRGSSIERPGHIEHKILPLKDHCWRGIIAKGGSPVCNARCVPIGKGIDSQLPEVVNCSARTGLDMLAKHYADASGFDIVFFLPDSEEDFASYTEFLRYLGAKNRAGVAKLDDGTTLFLVPPSEFLANVLNVSGPERLYGVVLKMPHQSASLANMQQHIHPQEYIDRPIDHKFIPQKDQFSQVNYDRILHEEVIPHAGGAKPLIAQSEQLCLGQSLPPDVGGTPVVPPQGGVSLTPELIATLAALIPKNTQSPASTAAQSGSSSSMNSASFPASATPDTGMPLQNWNQEHQIPGPGAPHSLRDEQTIHRTQQFGHQYNNQSPVFSQIPTYGNVANGAENSAEATLGGQQFQESSLNMQQSSYPSRPVSNYGIPFQGGQFTLPQANQQHQLDASQNYGMVNATDTAGVFHPSLPQQPKLITPVSQSQSVNASQLQMSLSSATDQIHAGLPSQIQQLQSVLSAPAQGTSDSDADKNQRYQSTLQFAASLLQQIQQQQANSQTMQGSGSQR
ncbi:hypothetical protein ACLOJK_008955 [Asimina triloba]